MKSLAPIVLYLITPLLHSQGNDSYLDGKAAESVAARASVEAGSQRAGDPTPAMTTNPDQMRASAGQGAAEAAAPVVSVGTIRRDMPMFSGKRQDQDGTMPRKRANFSLIHLPRR